MGHDQTDRPEPLLSHRRLRKDIRRHHPARRERNTTGGAGGPLITGADQELINEATPPHFDVSRFFIPTGQEWALPRGAFSHGAGPS